MIADVINQRKEANLRGEGATENDAKDLLDLILDADTDGLLTTDELVQNTYLFFLAGMCRFGELFVCWVWFVMSWFVSFLLVCLFLLHCVTVNLISFCFFRLQLFPLTRAGQETSAGSLVSALYFLGKHPECQARAYEEVVRVCQGEDITAQHVDEFKYIDACLKGMFGERMGRSCSRKETFFVSFLSSFLCNFSSWIDD
jgi:hypothetical protein